METDVTYTVCDTNVIVKAVEYLSFLMRQIKCVYSLLSTLIDFIVIVISSLMHTLHLTKMHCRLHCAQRIFTLLGPLAKPYPVNVHGKCTAKQ